MVLYDDDDNQVNGCFCESSTSSPGFPGTHFQRYNHHNKCAFNPEKRIVKHTWKELLGWINFKRRSAGKSGGG